MTNQILTKNKKIVLVMVGALLAVVVVGLIVWAAYDFPTTEEVNMTVQATMIAADGSVGEPFSLSVNWKLTHYQDEDDTLTAKIAVGPYELDLDAVPADIRPDRDYLVASGLSFNKDTNAYTSTTLALDPEKGYFMLSWKNDGTYLVASTDSQTTAQQVLDHFDELYTDNDSPTTEEITLTVQATMIAADGSAGDPFSLSVNWKLAHYQGKSDTLTAKVAVGPYELDWDAIPADIRPDLDYLVTSSLSFDKDANAYISTQLALDPEEGCFILKWQDGTYLVASTDSQATVQQVLDHFDEFVADYLQ